MSFLKATAVGNIGSMQDIKYLDNGMAVISFSIATNEKVKNKSGEWEDVTTWIRCSVFGKTAEAVAKYTSVGSQIYVEGRLKLNEYETKDGKVKTSLEINVTDVQFLSFNSKNEEQPDRNTEQPKQKSAKASSITTDDIPF